MNIKLKLKEEYFLLLFFSFGLFLTLNIDKLPISHPGNIKAADPFYHAISVESILETKQWDYYNYYLSLGTDKVINHQPPLIYTAAAMLSEFTGLPAWISLYFLICLSQALFIIAVYLIALEAFENKKIALLAAGLSILPMPVSFWLYGVYIGLWLQVPSYFLIMALLWLTIKYFKTRKDYLLLAMGFAISAITLLHIADLMIVFFEMLAIGILLLIGLFKDKDFFSFIKKGLMISLFPIISIITVLPRILFIWSGLGGNMFTPGFYGFSRNVFPKEQYGGMVWPEFSVFPAYIKILFFIGMLLLMVISLLYILSLFSKRFGMPILKAEKGSFVLSMKKSSAHKSYFILFLVIIVYFASVYLSPAFFSDPYYLGGRARALQPFFVYPVVAFAIFMFILLVERFAIKKESNHLLETFIILIVVAAAIVSGTKEYGTLTTQISGEHITETKWNAYVWLHENSPKEAVVLFFDGVFQGESIYSKRISGVMSIEDLNSFLKQYQAQNKTPDYVHISGWSGNTLREGAWKVEKSFFDYGNYSEFGSNRSITSFDYIVFQNFAQEVLQVNSFVASEYVRQGWRPVYNDGTSIILQNERK